MEDRFAFLTEWYDPSAALLRRYQLLFYPRDGSVEMFDVKNQRVFLRRTPYKELRQDDLFVGNRVNVFSRQLNLIGYGDQYTANKLGSKKERTLAMIKPDAVTKVGEIIQKILDRNLIVTKAKMIKLSWEQAADFYAEHQSKPFFNNLMQFVTSGPVIAMEVMGDEAVSAWRELLGPTDSDVARKDFPESLRAQFGTDGTQNAGHGSDSLASAARELEFFFPTTAGRGPPNTAKFTDCTCCIIKPHAISEALTGKILNSIHQAGFEISALQMFNMDRANAEDFFEVYKGVVAEYPLIVAVVRSLEGSFIFDIPEPNPGLAIAGSASWLKAISEVRLGSLALMQYRAVTEHSLHQQVPASVGTLKDMVTELCSGACMALEIHAAEAPRQFREFCGPADPEIARHLRPTTLRALYGKNKVQNAVHCTDLPEDAVLEVQYFFKILDG